MKDTKKTKAQLISELEELRKIIDTDKTNSTRVESEQKILSFVEKAAGFGVYQVEINKNQEYGTQNIFVSPNVEEILGTDELNRKASWFSNIHADDKDRVVKAHITSRDTGRVFDETFQVFHNQKKEWRWIHAISAPVISDDGSFSTFNGVLIDVTDSKRIENTLFHKTTMLDNILRSANDISIITTDLNQVITYFNPTAEKIFSLSAEDVIGKTVSEVHEGKPISPASVDKILENVRATGEFTFTVKRKTPEGLKYIQSRISDIFNSNSKLVGYSLFTRDVTESKQAENILKDSKKKYKNLVESTADWVWAFDLEGNLTFSNNAIKELLGFEVQEVINGSTLSLTHPDDTKIAKTMIKDAIKSKKGWSNVEIKWVHKDKSIKIFESSSRPIFNAENTLIGFTCIDRDITEQRKTLEALHKSEFDLRSLFNSMTDVVFEMDYNGKYINIAPTSQELMFKPTPSSVGKTLHDVFSKNEADKFLLFIQKCINEDRPLTIEYPLVLKDKTLWFEGKATPKTKNTVLFIASDITRKKQLEEQVKHRLYALTQPDVDLGDLVLTDILDISILQKMQDNFSNAFNMPSILYNPDGKLITKPSNFTSFCQLARSTKKGAEKCEKFDRGLLDLVKNTGTSQIRQNCILKNIVTGTVPMLLQGKHIANWGIGQMITDEPDITEIEKYADFINVDKQEFVEAAKELVPVDTDSFKKVLEFLTTLSDQISLLALQNLQQSRDISARNRAEQELLDERKLFVSGPTVIFTWKAADGWPVEYVTPNVQSIFGITAEQFTSGEYLFADIIHPDDSTRVGKEIEEYAKNGVNSFEQVYRIIRPDSEFRWLLDITTIIRDVDGEITNYRGYVLDITDRKKSQLERTRFMRAIEQTGEAIIITDTDGIIEYINPAFERVSGYSRDGVIGKSPSILQSGLHEPTFYANMWAQITDGKNWTGQIVNKRKNGSLYTEKVTISPVLDSTGIITNYVAVKQDVSAEIKLQEQLRQSQKMDAVGQLAGGIAHDFNNLLQVMNGYTDLTLEELNPKHPTYDFVSEVKVAGHRASALVNQLLSFSRQQIMKPVDLDLNLLTKNLMKMIHRVIGEHIECNFIPGHELGTIHADSGQLEQVLINLCVNSRDALPTGGSITIETTNVLVDSKYRKTHPLAEDGRFVLLSVSDNGIGMTKQTQENLFEPFFTTKSVGKGTGLGLATVYGIVKQHNGDIQVYSELNKGSVFKIYFPIVERKATDISSNIIEQTIGGTETILIAEDDKKVRALTQKTLVAAGYTVIEARDGEEAIKFLKEYSEKIDFLFLDVVMPKLGGKEVYDSMDRNQNIIPTLFCSGYIPDNIHNTFVLDSALNFIQKPYTPNKLLRKIRKILDT